MKEKDGYLYTDEGKWVPRTIYDIPPPGSRELKSRANGLLFVMVGIPLMVTAPCWLGLILILFAAIASALGF